MLSQISQKVLAKYLEEFRQYSRKEILEQRKNKFLTIGQQRAFKIFSQQHDWIAKDSFFASIKAVLSKYKKVLTISVFIIILGIIFFI